MRSIACEGQRSDNRRQQFYEYVEPDFFMMVARPDDLKIKVQCEARVEQSFGILFFG